MYQTERGVHGVHAAAAVLGFPRVCVWNQFYLLLFGLIFLRFLFREFFTVALYIIHFLSVLFLRRRPTALVGLPEGLLACFVGDVLN